MPVSFRDAETADLEVLAALVNSAYRGESSRAGWTTEADLLDGQRTDTVSLAAELSRDTTMIILATEEGRLCGCVKYDRSSTPPELGMLAVDPQRQAGGMGTLLLAEVERRARLDGYDQLDLEVVTQRAELIAFYQRRGFCRTGVELPFPYGDERFGVPRRDDLRFIQLRKDLRD